MLPQTPEEDGGQEDHAPRLPLPQPLFSSFCILGSPVPFLSPRDLGEGLPQASLFEALPCRRCWEWPRYPLPGHLFWF